MADVYIALIHHPVYDKQHKVVTTSITNIDIHDIARSALTYGVKRYFVVNPVRTLHALAEKILNHWQYGYGSVYNKTRKDALATVSLAETLDGVLESIVQETREQPRVIATSARGGDNRVTFSAVRSSIEQNGRPVLLLFGTGWGLTEEVFAQTEAILEPIQGTGAYNHLSVRAAVAILLDRLLGVPARSSLETPA